MGEKRTFECFIVGWVRHCANSADSGKSHITRPESLWIRLGMCRVRVNTQEGWELCTLLACTSSIIYSWWPSRGIWCPYKPPFQHVLLGQCHLEILMRLPVWFSFLIVMRITYSNNLHARALRWINETMSMIKYGLLYRLKNALYVLKYCPRFGKSLFKLS